MALTLRLIAILGLLALSTIPFAIAEEEDEEAVIIDGSPVNDDDNDSDSEED